MFQDRLASLEVYYLEYDSICGVWRCKRLKYNKTCWLEWWLHHEVVRDSCP